jgi:hypothetical protein
MANERTEITRPIGINKDLSPYELPAETWSDGSDIYFRRQRTVKGSGYANVFDLLDTVISPIYNLYYTDGISNFWIYAGDSDIYKTDGSVTPVVMGTGFSAVATNNWTGCNFNGLAVLNQSADHPQIISPDDTNTVIDMPNWGTQEADSTVLPADYNWGPLARTNVIRPYKNYLFALDNTDDNGTEYPLMIRWSSPAQSGDVPPSWDPTSVAEQAGLYVIADSPGRVVDGLTLGDYFVVYKTDAVWVIQFIGGQFNFSFRKLFGEGSGALAKDCVGEFDGRHFVFSPNGAYIHNGSSQTDIMEPWVKDEFFNAVNPKLILQTKVVVDHQNNECWVYFITLDSPDGWFDKALIWNWETKEWTIKNLGLGIAYVAEGIIEPSDGVVANNDWDSQTTSWTDNSEKIWNSEYTSDPTAKGLLLADNTLRVLYSDGTGLTYAGVAVVGYVKRIGIDFNDDESFKYVTRVTPHIIGQNPIEITMYAEDVQTSNPTLIGTYEFNPTIDQSVDCHVTGRYIGIRFSGTNAWTLTGYTLEWESTGIY